VSVSDIDSEMFLSCNILLTLYIKVPEGIVKLWLWLTQTFYAQEYQLVS